MKNSNETIGNRTRDLPTCINMTSGMSLYVDDHLVCTLNGHLHRVTYTKCHINTIDSPDDEQRSHRNM